MGAPWAQHPRRTICPRVRGWVGAGSSSPGSPGTEWLMEEAQLTSAGRCAGADRTARRRASAVHPLDLTPGCQVYARRVAAHRQASGRSCRVARAVRSATTTASRLVRVDDAAAPRAIGSMDRWTQGRLAFVRQAKRLGFCARRDSRADGRGRGRMRFHRSRSCERSLEPVRCGRSTPRSSSSRRSATVSSSYARGQAPGRTATGAASGAYLRLALTTSLNRRPIESLRGDLHAMPVWKPDAFAATPTPR